MRCAFGQQSGGCFFSVEVCVFSCCVTCPIRHGATQTSHKNKNNKDSKSQHFEKFAAEVAQLEASTADLTERFAAVPSNSEVNAKIEADESAVRKEHSLLNAQTVSDSVARVEASRGGPEGNSRARGCPRCHFFLASRSIAYEVRATERQQTWHH